MAITGESIKNYGLHTVGFHKIGIARIEQQREDSFIAHLQRWLGLGYQGDMAWMANPRRQDITQVLPEARSVISVGLNYYTPHRHSEDPAIGKISRYGWGRDYHKVMTRKLKQLNQWLQDHNDNLISRYYVDTGPVQDKAWAQRSGIGWIGKHSNVITRDYGSWLFLGEIITNLELEPDRPHTAHCGTCTRCLDACPTNAIREPYVVDADRCIAYHTIENREPELPEEIKHNLQGWVAGCDICQDVCPWNQRFAQITDVKDFEPYPPNVNPPLNALAELGEADWDQRFRGSALRRIKPAMWRRNAQANLDLQNKKDGD